MWSSNSWPWDQDRLFHQRSQLAPLFFNCFGGRPCCFPRWLYHLCSHNRKLGSLYFPSLPTLGIYHLLDNSLSLRGEAGSPLWVCWSPLVDLASVACASGIISKKCCQDCLIMAHDSFNVLLNSVCRYFVEIFCASIFQGYWSYRKGLSYLVGSLSDFGTTVMLALYNEQELFPPL